MTWTRLCRSCESGPTPKTSSPPGWPSGVTRLEVLRGAADAGDQSAAMQLARLLAERGDLDELHARINADDLLAAERLADLLAAREFVTGRAR